METLIMDITMRRGISSDLFGNDWYNFGTVGATISIPLFEGFSKKTKIQQSK